MPWNDSDELVVGGSGQVYVAPVGTALPTSPTASLNAAFVGLGLTSEDGVAITVTPEIQDFGAWQSRQPVRRALIGQSVGVGFSLEQWNENNVVLAFGGGTVETVSGGYKYTFPDGDDALDERAMVIDIVDGSEHHRFVWNRGNVSDAVGANFRRNELSMLPITFQVLSPADDPNGAPGYYLTDSTAFATGS